MRIALFSDSCHEADGVANTASAIEECARRRRFQVLSVRPGTADRRERDGSVVHLDLARSRRASFSLDRDLRFDLAIWRHARDLANTVREFAPDVLHFTGPSDVGQLGAWLGHRLGIPMVGSWQTNLHERVSRHFTLPWASDSRRAKIRVRAEAHALRALLLFYKIPRVVLAPDARIADLLAQGTRRPTYVMSSRIDTDTFTPRRRTWGNTILNIGYVGPLAADTNVRLLREVESLLDGEGLDVRFTIVGEGSERAWLREHMLRARYTGVLQGDALAMTYAQMDIFACPQGADTSGHAILEAMASGVPVVAMARGSRTLVSEQGRSVLLAADAGSFIDAVRTLVRDRPRREAMGVAARARALDSTSWDRLFDDVLHAYRMAISLANDERRRRLGTPTSPAVAIARSPSRPWRAAFTRT
jgi:phosphatidylinositol alpha 1,6-mannosyltransferase